MSLSLVLNRVRRVPAEQSPAFGAIAERFRRAGELERAVELAREGLRTFPDHLSARVTLGWALMDLGHYEDARAELEAVLGRAPDNLAAIRGLAELHDRTEHDDVAHRQEGPGPWPPPAEPEAAAAPPAWDGPADAVPLQTPAWGSMAADAGAGGAFDPPADVDERPAFAPRPVFEPLPALEATRIFETAPAPDVEPALQPTPASDPAVDEPRLELPLRPLDPDRPVAGGTLDELRPAVPFQADFIEAFEVPDLPIEFDPPPDGDAPDEFSPLERHAGAAGKVHHLEHLLTRVRARRVALMAEYAAG